MPRRSSTADLPPAHLGLIFPLTVPGPDIQGAVILAETPDDVALHVLTAFRFVVAWAARESDPQCAPATAAVASWEGELLGLHGKLEDEIWAPLEVIASELLGGDRVDLALLTRACASVSEWAFGRGAEGTALLFAEAAAVAWPNNSRLAWLAGRLHRAAGHTREAEQWLRRAARVGVWTRDFEAQAISLHSLGNLKLHQGDIAESRRLLFAALKLAQRQRLPERRARVYHDLFVAAVEGGELEEAERHVRSALASYGAGHPSLLDLAFDVAHLWAEQGHFGRAILVLEALLPHFQDADRALRVAASAARAAGALGNTELFWGSWARAWEILNAQELPQLRAAAAFQLGVGAMNLSLWDEAKRVFDVSRKAAEAGGEADVLAELDPALDALARYQAFDRSRGRSADSLATSLARSLGDVQAPGSGPGACT